MVPNGDLNGASGDAAKPHNLGLDLIRNLDSGLSI